MIQELKITGNGVINLPLDSQSLSQSLSQSPMCFSSSQSQVQVHSNDLFHASPSKNLQIHSQRDSQKITPIVQHAERHSKNLKLLFDSLQDERPLGTGASSAVYLVKDKVSNSMFAKKVIRISDNIQPRVILQEIKALYRCKKSPYICRFYDAFYRNEKIHILLEFMDAGSLHDVMRKAEGGKVPEHILSLIAVQVLRGLHYLHAVKKIIHRDIKPQNILMKRSGEVKISDFGLTGIGSNKGSSYGLNNPMVFETCQGTILYMSVRKLL